MVTRRLALVGIEILILVLWPLSFLTGIAFGYNLEEYYPIGEGDRWRYSVTEDDERWEELVQVAGRETVNGRETVKIIEGESQYKYVIPTAQDIQLYKIVDEEGQDIFVPPTVLFRDLKIGEDYYSKSQITTYKNGSEKMDMATHECRITLGSPEDIEIPAGKFKDCLKFFSIDIWKEPNGDWSRSDISAWLAAGIGIVKEFTVSTDYNAETKEEETAMTLRELVSAVINGEEIGGQ